MKRTLIVVGALTALAFTGCASASLKAELSSSNVSTIEKIKLAAHEFTAQDFSNAAKEGIAARDAGGLSKLDRWPECFMDIGQRLDAASAIAGTATDKSVGVATLIMRAHIAKNRIATPVDANCAQVILDLERDGVKIGIGQAAGIVPGGGIAVKGIESLPTLLQLPGLLGR